MHPSLRCCSARAHTPLIKFLGRRSWPNMPEPPHPHPAAPTELKLRFSEFITKMNSSSGVYNEFWEAPSRLWQPRTRHLTKQEMDAVMSGGASSY